MFQYKWPAELDAVRDIMETVELQMAELGLDQRRVLHMGLVAEEIAANIVNHAYADQTKPATDNHILLTIEHTNGTIRMEFRDKGIPFDPNQIPEPDITAPVTERDVGGLGIYFVRNLVDKVHYQRDGSDNCWTFEIQTQGEPNSPA